MPSNFSWKDQRGASISGLKTAEFSEALLF